MSSKRLRSVVAFMAAAALVSACADRELTGPTPDSAGVPSSVSLSSGASLSGLEQPPPSHLVVFRSSKSAPSDFAAAVAGVGGTVEFVVPRVGFASVAGLDEAGVAALAGRKDVIAVELDTRISLDLPGVGQVEAADLALDPGVHSPADPATSFFFPRQWHHRAIGADLAWAVGELGSPDVTVAILDTGIDYLHPDLAGLVDLSRSASFVPADDAFVDAFFPGRNHITDLHFHGTHVASTVSSNALAVSGVTSRTTLIGVKVCDVFGSCPSTSVFAGVIHAADAGADIINMSLGGTFVKSDFPGFVSVINRVMNYARQKGTLLVVSAGNAGIDLDHNGNSYATYCDAPAVACVSATGPSFAPTTAGPFDNPDTPTAYSNFGRSAIHVAAPGGSGSNSNPNLAAGWVWQACSQTSLVIPICQTGVFTLGVNGTSMSSPHAAGVAAILAQGTKNAGQLRSKLQQTADDLGQPGTDPFFGKGRVNAATAAGAN